VPSERPLSLDETLSLDEMLPLDEMSVAELTSAMHAYDRAVPAAIEAALPAITAAVEAAEGGFAAGGRLIYAGAGTSGRLGVLDASECPPTFHTDPSRVVGLIAGGPPALVTAVENAEDNSEAGAAAVRRLGLGAEDILVGVAASGRTPYVLGALRAARSAGAVTIGLSCRSPAELSAVAEHAIEVDVGPEIVRGSTRLKAGTAQKQVLNMISTTLMVRAGRTYGNLMVEVSASNEKLRRRAVELVCTLAGVDEPTAADTLDLADLEVKTATVMLVRGDTAAGARARLDRAGGRLGVAIGIPSSTHPALS
jgi:N-acetylmuramic acid 6-phosphate etherase